MTTGQRIDYWIINHLLGLLTDEQYGKFMGVVLVLQIVLKEFNNSFAKEE